MDFFHLETFEWNMKKSMTSKDTANHRKCVNYTQHIDSKST